MSETKAWLRFGECVEIARGKGVSKKTFLKLLEAEQVEKKLFPGCARHHYSRASLMKVLQTGQKP